MLVEVNDDNREIAVRGIAHLEQELFAKGAWSENMVREELLAPARNYVMDVSKEESDKTGTINPADIQGYAGYWFDGDDAEIMTIGVRADMQRQGIASRMMRWMTDKASQQGAHRILLEVRVDNDAALNMYHRFGFSRLGLRKRYYQPEGVDAYTMALEIDRRPIGFESPHQKTEHHINAPDSPDPKYDNESNN